MPQINGCFYKVVLLSSYTVKFFSSAQVRYIKSSNERKSMQITINQRKSMKISSNQRNAMNITITQRKPMKISSNQRNAMKIIIN